MEIRKTDRHDRLTKLKMKEYRKFTGKLNCVSQCTGPHLIYTVLTISRKNNTATIADLFNCNKVWKKVKK